VNGRLKRSLLAALAVAAAIAPVHADDYPSRQIELIVPFAPGGGSGLVARMLSDGLAKRYGQAVIVINRPGGNTNIGTVSVVRAKPDGYTLGIASVGMTANPSLYKNLNYDPQTEIEPISLLANSPTVLVVPPSLPVNTLAEFIAYSKARPGELNYASYGAGSGPHMATELFQSLTGVKMVHVPYGGGGPASLGVMTGQVQALFSSVLPVVSMIKAGTLKAIAIAAERRLELLPDVPTFKESGLDYRTGTWFGLFAPAKTPPAIIGSLHKATVEIFREPSARARVVEFGGEVVANSPAEFRAFIKDETEYLAKVVQGAGIRLD
jgi:tripartite-type tricarboxylate transporter receptor subunit TctC